MASSEAQRRWRSRDPKKTVEVRLSPAAVERLDQLRERSEALGRGEVIERLVLATADGGPAKWLLNEAIRLGREYLRMTNTDEGTLRDLSGWHYTIRRTR